MDSARTASLWQQMVQGLQGSDNVWPLPAFIDRSTFSSAFAVSELAATAWVWQPRRWRRFSPPPARLIPPRLLPSMSGRRHAGSSRAFIR